MQVKAGDHLLVRGHKVTQPDRNAEVLKVLGANGGPPYQVRWSEDGREGLFFPGSDASVEKVAKTPKKRQK
ncbi:MAG: DUF1918 domain-containing protein [Acidimicrobiales bacterium]|jgi:uncharacterized protein DUF1918